MAGSREYGSSETPVRVDGSDLLSAGVEPEDTSWWRSDDLWSHAFDAAVVFVRAASERRRVTIAAICTALRND